MSVVVYDYYKSVLDNLNIVGEVPLVDLKKDFIILLILSSWGFT